MNGDSFSDRMKRRFLGRGSSWEFKPLAMAAQGSPRVEGEPEFDINLCQRLNPDERGAVWPILPADAYSDDKVTMTEYPADEEAIRTMLIFFDKFDIPDQMMFGPRGWCTDQFESVGLLVRSKVRGRGKLEEVLKVGSFAVFDKHDQRQPGQWSISRPAQTLGIPASKLSKRTALALTLQNALPVFTREVALGAVVEFKHRRMAELSALRTHMEDVAKRASTSERGELSDSVEVRRFSESLAEYARTMQESNHRKVWRSLRASFDWIDLASPFGEAVWTHTFPAGTLIGVGAAMSIKTVQGLKRKRTGSNPFEYLTSAYLEL